MRLLMGVSKNRHGTYYAVKKVPTRLGHAVAQVLGGAKATQSWLKRSLGTKVLSEANVRAKLILADFDRIISQAEAQFKARPLRASLSAIEIKRIADYFYAHELEADQELREDSRGSDPLYASVHKQLEEAGVAFTKQDDLKSLTLEAGRGLSTRMMRKIEDDTTDMLVAAEDALARGDNTTIRYEVDALLEVFQINLDRAGADYRKLALAVLAAHVKQLRAVLSRQKGEPVETPPLVLQRDTDMGGGALGETLRGAFEGWKRQRQRAAGTQVEYERAIKLFAELHGDLPVVQIKRSHARQFREALQDVPRRRSGKLLKAPLPELAEWGRKYPEAQKIHSGTVNKLLGGVQAVAVWARENGIVPEDAQWADPFSRMRLDVEDSKRAPFETTELKAVFNTPVFTQGERPTGGKGETAFWLPLLSLLTGARRGELAGLRASDVAHDDAIGAVSIYITEDRKAGKRLKNRQSARVVPVHPELVKLGFLKFAARQAKERGESAWLFPQIAPATTGAKAWSKWFIRYIRTHGVPDTAKVFHSFRHGFIDALRAARVSDEVHFALVGHSDGSVHAGYGAKELARRFGKRLSEAVASVSYANLDFSHLTPRTSHGPRQAVTATKAHRRTRK